MLEDGWNNRMGVGGSILVRLNYQFNLNVQKKQKCNCLRWGMLCDPVEVNKEISCSFFNL